ncbi:hypothetical protein Q7P37_007356 [Cladosporium fusiforme]
MRLSVDYERDEASRSPSMENETPITDDEQEQGLLDHKSRHERLPAPERSRHCTTTAWWFICLVLLLSILTGASYYLSTNRTPKASPQTDTGIQINDYVLSSNWDHSTPPQRREYFWTVRDHVHNPDGVYRPMILINHQFPGPLIQVNEGDTVVVHVDNKAANATAIHWHGIYQIGTPHMDGTVGVTQCPIAPGQTFTYEFTVTGQSGTYWYHGHQGLQASDGLNGPLIVHGKNERTLQELSYDTDRVVMLSDHYHDLSSALLWQYLMPDMENAEPVPQSGLINGKNIRNCDDFPTRHCDNTTANVGLPSIVLDRNKSHRLRLINVGAIADFSVQLDEHELAVTEVDGTDVHPMSYHRLNISPAQRYSVVLRSNASSADTFWLRARMVTSCFSDIPKTLQADTYAVVRYEEGALAEPTSQDWAEKLSQDCKDLNVTELTPVEEIEVSADPDAVFYLRSNFEIGAYRLSRGFFNGSSWRANAGAPALQRSIDGLSRSYNNLSALSSPRSLEQSGGQQVAFVNDRAFDADSELVIQTTGVQTIDILISNFDDGTHPYHLHGYKFFVLAQGHGQPPLTEIGAAINRESLSPLYKSLDLSNPLRRDTASVEAYGWILLRVITDNPGQWALHCHLSWHAEAGLLMQLLANTDELAKIEIPKANRDLCTAEGIEKGMGPNDDDYIDFAK